MKKSVVVLLVGLVLLFVITGVVFARGGRASGNAIEIRVASPLPQNSDWGRTLNRIAGEVHRQTNGAVRLTPMHDGVHGSESTMISRLATNTIQGALLTSFGISGIVPAVMNLSVPFKIRDDAELELVLREILPYLEEQTNSTNFVILAWSKAGWVNIFSREPVLEPSDLRRMTLATSPDSENMNRVFREMEFELMEAEVAEMATLLASGRVTALYQSPAAIAPMGLQRHLGNMLDMPIAPFMGAIVLNRTTWNRLGPENQRIVMDVTRRIAAEFDTTMPRTINNAVTSMQRGGLNVNRPTPQQQALWHNEARDALSPLLGQTFDYDMYHRISMILERARNGQ